MKIVVNIVIIGLVVVGGFYAFNTYIYNEKQGGEGNSTDEMHAALTKYFEDQMIARGVADIGQPIEGFDAYLLMTAYAGLKSSDFAGVKSFEGMYSVENEEVVYTREAGMPVTSAEQTVSSAGYATLLENVSARLSHSVMSEADIDALIQRIDQSERVSAGLGETVSALGVSITPEEILEDSRCPVDVECIQAGTVRVRVTLINGLGSAEQEFKLSEPVTTGTEEITLVAVMPVAESTVDIDEKDYLLTFEVKKR